MIDIHSHILPTLDDGAQNMSDSVALLKNAYEQGVTRVIATPHIHIGVFNNPKKTIEISFNSLVNERNKLKLDLEIGYAAEVRISPDIIPLIESNQIPFLGKYNGNNVLLLELPHSHIPIGYEKFIHWLLRKNITPMIAHPERNRDVWKDASLLDFFVQNNCLMQVTAASILGDFKSYSQVLAWSLLELPNTVVASDMHNLSNRPCKMDQAKKIVFGKLGVERTKQLFEKLPKLITDFNSTLC